MKYSRLILLAGVIAAPLHQVQAMDFTQGLLTAVPTPNGKAPVIDGNLQDWDKSAAEPTFISPETVHNMGADWALMYDEEALYISAHVLMPGRPYTNPNNPQDGFWWGDLVQLRVGTDPALPYPLNRDIKSDRVNHISIWKNTETNKDFIHLGRGVRIDMGAVVNPEGSAVVITTDTDKSYTVEAKIPWAALNTPGGTNPMKNGARMTAIFETLWIGGDSTRVAMNYRSNPGTFAFQQSQTWGQVEFAAQGLGKRRRPTLQELAVQHKNSAATAPLAPGVPIEIDVPAAGKVSVNILDEKGAVIRELTGGLERPKGKFTLTWDGKDAFGHGMPPGNYRWGAYFSGGLKAKFFGAVGKSGNPYWHTADGLGGWGADHSNPIDVTSDSSGLYMLWTVSESGKAIVKTDLNGKVIWRKTPFVGGGYGPFFTITSNEKYLFLILGESKVRLIRLDAKTGQLLTWGPGASAELMVGDFTLANVPPASSPLNTRITDARHQAKFQPESTGIAATGTEVFLSSYAGNKILVFHPETGAKIRELDCPGPRGLKLAANGDLLAVSYVPGQPGKVVRFAATQGAAVPVISSNLEAPWNVAQDKSGRLYVSDLGAAQQVKVFSAAGQLVETRGKAGGRPWIGKYEGNAFLHPAGLTVDSGGGLVVVESSIPKVITRFNAADGKTLNRWFGAPVYWTSTWPSPDDPRDIFYPLNAGLGRARITKEGETGMPYAYIAPREAGYLHSSDFEDRINQPETVKVKSGKTLLLSDASPFTVGLLEGHSFRPAAHFKFTAHNAQGNTTKKNLIEFWRDTNGDGQIQPDEVKVIDTVAGAPLVLMATQTSAMHMEPNGDLYFMTQANSVLKLPATGFARDGAPTWDFSRASYVVPKVLPSVNAMSTTWRHGLLGSRVDKAGNLYVAFNTSVPGSGQPFDFATPQLAKAQKEGMGHTATFNVVKFGKYDPNGKLLWMAGRKATAAAKPGEMFHFWNMAGLVNDKYIAGASEWGQIYFYTHDGFFVDALMNNPGLSPLPGPYTFGGETSGGRVQYFPARDELWAYVSGMAYRVEGFSKGSVQGEKRLSGTVKLDKVYESAVEVQETAPLQMLSVNGDAFSNPGLWNGLAAADLKGKEGNLAKVQLAHDAANIYARIQVTDGTPLQSEADNLLTAIKGGDSAALVLGPAGSRPGVGPGDIRLMAAIVNNKPVLVAMKPVTAQAKKPDLYFTPAAGEVKFEYLGEVPGGRLELVPTDGGYTATFSVPKSFLEVEVAAGKSLRGDIEIRLSGAGQRGLQVTSRNYLFTPARPETTMVDDTPTEARLYPQYWGELQVK